MSSDTMTPDKDLRTALYDTVSPVFAEPIARYLSGKAVESFCVTVRQNLYGSQTGRVAKGPGMPCSGCLAVCACQTPYQLRF